MDVVHAAEQLAAVQEPASPLLEAKQTTVVLAQHTHSAVSGGRGRGDHTRGAVRQ